jgi:hypothetical protein
LELDLGKVSVRQGEMCEAHSGDGGGPDVGEAALAEGEGLERGASEERVREGKAAPLR